MNLCEGTWLPQCGWLLLWPVVGVLGALTAGFSWMARDRLAQIVRGDLLEQVVPRSVRARRTVRDVLAFTGLALALFALAGPRFDKQLQIVRASGTDLVILLDLSRSMNARDVDPSRLERARREIADLGRLIEGDRVGLVVFAGAAYPRLPLTEDFTALELVVSETDTDSFQAQGSNLGAAIREALDLLDNHEDQAGQALIVLSDGETHQPDEALAAAQEASARGVPIYTMGIGIEPAPVPMPDGRPMSHQGRPVLSSPDFTTLEDVARITGGAFVQSNAAANDMTGLYGEIRDTIQAVARDFHQRETWREAFGWPLSIALLCLLGAGWIGEGRRSFGAASTVVLALGLASSSARAGPLEDADALYREGRYEAAAEQYTQLSLEQPGDVEILDRLGAARYRAGDYDGAARAFDEALSLSDDSDLLFNSGNAHYQAGRLERALSRYDEALEVSPGHRPALRNRGIVEDEIARRRQIQPPPPPQPQPQPGGDSEQPEESPPGDQPEPPEDPGEGPPPPDPSGEQAPPQGEPGEQDAPPQGEPDDPGSSGAVDPEEVEEQSEERPADEGGIDSDGEAGPISASQAHRLLDSIEEGSQRVQVRGRSGDKPW